MDNSVKLDIQAEVSLDMVVASAYAVKIMPSRAADRA
jgi:hypothetical protein